MVITNQRERDGFGVHFCYRVHHLQQWADQLAIFKARVATNPFAVVALAQLAAHRRTSDPERKASKREIIWLLYESGYGRDDVLALLRFIDWMLRLPAALELELRGELIALEEQQKMSYVMSIERMAEERGVQIGEQRGEQRGEADADTLLAWSERVLSADTIDDIVD